MRTFSTKSHHEIYIAFARYQPGYVHRLLEHFRALFPNVRKVCWKAKRTDTFYLMDGWVVDIEDGDPLQGHIEVTRIDNCRADVPRPPAGSIAQWGVPFGFTLSTSVTLTSHNSPSIQTIADTFARLPRPIRHLDLGGLQFDSAALVDEQRLQADFVEIASESLVIRMMAESPDDVFHKLIAALGINLTSLTFHHVYSGHYHSSISFAAFRRFITDMPTATPCLQQLSLSMHLTSGDNARSEAFRCLQQLWDRGGSLDTLILRCRHESTSAMMDVARYCALLVVEGGCFSIMANDRWDPYHFIDYMRRLPPAQRRAVFTADLEELNVHQYEHIRAIQFDEFDSPIPRSE